MPDPRHVLGARGEDLACAELARRGYAVIARGYRTRHGELDVVARHDGVLVFVEVKTRDGRSYGNPAEAVTPQKQRRVAAMAEDYLARHGPSTLPCRFDVVAVESDLDPPTITVYPDAFRPGW